MDPTGALRLVGRTRSLIALPNGMNVHPEDVEAALVAEGLVEPVVYEAGPGRIAIAYRAGAAFSDPADEEAAPLATAVRAANQRLAPHQRIAGRAPYPEPDFPRRTPARCSGARWRSGWSRSAPRPDQRGRCDGCRGGGGGAVDPLAAADSADDAAVARRARELYLDDANLHGCAETAFVVLKEAFGLPDAADSSAAMALNGGVAYSGATCGAVTGAAMALGELAASRIADHREAKRAARDLTAALLVAFEAEFGATTCRAGGVDLRTEAGHRAFIEGGAWRDGCMRQIELAVNRLAPFADAGTWETATRGERPA